MTLQPSLFAEPETPVPSPARVRSLAGVLAGFAWPGAGSYEKLTQKQKAHAEQVARDALIQLANGAE